MFCPAWGPVVCAGLILRSGREMVVKECGLDADISRSGCVNRLLPLTVYILGFALASSSEKGPTERM